MNNTRDKEVLLRFGEKLKKLRTDKNLTLEALAYASNVELSQIYRIETGKINPTLTTLSAIASGLQITIAELTGEL